MVADAAVVETRDAKAVMLALIAGVRVTTTGELEVFIYGATPVIIPVGSRIGTGVMGTKAELGMALLLDADAMTVVLVVEVEVKFEVTLKVEVGNSLVTDEAMLEVSFIEVLELDNIVVEAVEEALFNETLLAVLEDNEVEVTLTLEVLYILLVILLDSVNRLGVAL